MVSGGMLSVTSLIRLNLLITSSQGTMCLSFTAFIIIAAHVYWGYYFISVSVWFCSSLFSQFPIQCLMQVRVSKVLLNECMHFLVMLYVLPSL